VPVGEAPAPRLIDPTLGPRPRLGHRANGTIRMALAGTSWDRLSACRGSTAGAAHRPVVRGPWLHDRASRSVRGACRDVVGPLPERIGEAPAPRLIDPLRSPSAPYPQGKHQCMARRPLRGSTIHWLVDPVGKHRRDGPSTCWIWMMPQGIRARCSTGAAVDTHPWDRGPGWGTGPRNHPYGSRRDVVGPTCCVSGKHRPCGSSTHGAGPWLHARPSSPIRGACRTS
jgi:hypothetical protein